MSTALPGFPAAPNSGTGSGNLTRVGWWAVTDRKPYRHRFPLSQRDVQELLHERGIQVSHATLRQWNMKFAPLLTEELRHREPRRGSRWHLDEVCVKVGGGKALVVAGS